MEAFDKYVEQFDLNNFDIAYKYYHCYRVQDLSNDLANDLNLDDENIYLANTIGLLHDIGRFGQLKEYSTYNDDKSIDHADYGCEVLFNKHVIDSFDIPKKYYPIIEKAIKNHNKFRIEQNLKPDELLQAKIIRDADKIDIFNAYTDLHAYSVTDNLGDVTPRVEQTFFVDKEVSHDDVHNKADELLLTLSFIYDINFKESLEIIEERDYINKLYKQIDNKRKYKKYFDFIKQYIKERIDI